MICTCREQSQKETGPLEFECPEHGWQIGFNYGYGVLLNSVHLLTPDEYEAIRQVNGAFRANRENRRIAEWQFEETDIP